MSSVLAVRKSALPSMPEPFRNYVAEFFRERDILGVPCMVAELHCYHPRRDPMARWGKGLAPCHGVDLARFGSVGKDDLNDWMRKAQKSRPSDIVELFCTERDSDSYMDDD